MKTRGYRFRKIWLGLTMLVASCSANATVLFESTGYPVVNTLPSADYCSNSYGYCKVFSPFSLSQASAITSIKFAIDAASASGVGDILVEAWAAPASNNVFSQTLGAGTYSFTNVQGTATDIVSASLAGLNLSAGNYYLSLYSSTDSLLLPNYGTPTWNYVTEHTAPGSSIYAYWEMGGTAFELLNSSTSLASVPEPDTLLLMGAGLVGLTALRYRTRTSRSPLA